MVSSRYQAPMRLLQPNSLGVGTTWKLLTLPCRKVVRLLNVVNLIAKLAPAAVTPPPITIPPGPSPLTNESLAGKDARGEESRLKPARENPASNALRTRGEKTCVSCTLATWERSVS